MITWKKSHTTCSNWNVLDTNKYTFASIAFFPWVLFVSYENIFLKQPGTGLCIHLWSQRTKEVKQNICSPTSLIQQRVPSCLRFLKICKTQGPSLVTLKVILPLCSSVLDEINQYTSVNHLQVWIPGAWRQNILHRGIENSFPPLSSIKTQAD